MSGYPEPAFEFQLQHMLAAIGEADNQCAECGVYRVDGKPPLLHRTDCESSGTAEHVRQMTNPRSPWTEIPTADPHSRMWIGPVGTPPDGAMYHQEVTDYGPPYLNEDGESS